MTMHYIYVGTGPERHRRYFIETHGGRPVAWFDDMDTAGIVLRYLKGANISPDERDIAHMAMRAFDNRGEGEVE